MNATDDDNDQDARDIWQILESPPKECECVTDLYSWSLNYYAGNGPFMLFLDIIGWSEDNIGQAMFDFNIASLGYIEIDRLAQALTEYTDRPYIVRDFVDLLMTKG